MPVRSLAVSRVCRCLQVWCTFRQLFWRLRMSSICHAVGILW
nr:MAG TPA: hypothetical protein [Caudoviricetes sp.]